MEEAPELWEPLTAFLSSHPSYYEVFQEATAQLLYGDGPLPMPYRHFVAIMAAARHGCEYLTSVHSAEFLRLGGEPEWLRLGLAAAPEKLQRLDELNRVLAHQPWTLTKAHLLALTKAPSPSNWSLSELMHGAMLLSHTHALASFVKGCGIISSQPPSPLDSSSRDENSEEGLVTRTSEVERLMARMKAAAESEPSTSALSPEEKAQLFNQVISTDAEKVNGKLVLSASPPGRSPSHSPRPDVAYTLEPGFNYVDFAKRLNPQLSPTFKIHDYSWEDEGYSLVSQLYGELSDLMDRKFRLARSLTYYTMGPNEGVDTRPFRTALWNYIQSLFGIRHDDYDYHLINELLQRRMKELVKTVCCYPSKTTEALRSGVMTEFLHSERVHVMLLLSEARQQSELLYFLRAVMNLTT